jgi:hypothetical protein
MLMAMFRTGELVDNPVTGLQTLIRKTERDTDGAYVEVDFFHQPFAGKNSSAHHFHPTWPERFEILTGLAGYRLGPRKTLPTDSSSTGTFSAWLGC